MDFSLPSSNKDFILDTLHHLNLRGFEDVTPKFLSRFVVESCVVVIACGPLRELYIKNYPEDGSRIVKGSWEFMSWEELLVYLNIYEHDSEIVDYILEKAEDDGYDYLIFKIKEWQEAKK